MNTVFSKDGTPIAYDKTGQGPALVIVLGALTTRNTGSTPGLASLLAPHFTVYTYDRRGRGDSGDTQPYTVAREVEDLEALLDMAGGTASVYSHSSGGGVALNAAAQLTDKIRKVAVYEVPYNDEEAAQQRWKAYGEQLSKAVADGQGGEATALFMKQVGMPDEQLEGMRHSPAWSYFESVGTSLLYDYEVMGDGAAVPEALTKQITCPVLALYGDASFPFMVATAQKLGMLLTHGESRALAGQEHNVDQKVLAPVLTSFFNDQA